MSVTHDTSQPLPVADVGEGALTGLAEDAEALYLAPNWKLVWWRFKRHRLALVSTAILSVIVLVALVPNFLSTQPPHESVTAEQFVPPQRIHLFDEGSFSPFVYGGKGDKFSRGHCPLPPPAMPANFNYRQS